ncbi:unnamed protein product [Penicillium roqueforti FM164]|uniref:Genomic scaffold, ProqFM164S03 n=1 Tax=Penicillium roqueforti (strain FM164) TaxID=1365484 RepID=W6QB68_PENRF|nr:unnamed protein product [Penicillium roqueforti FM164]
MGLVDLRTPWYRNLYARGMKIPIESLDVTNSIRASNETAGFIDVGPLLGDKSLEVAGMVDIQHGLGGVE